MEYSISMLLPRQSPRTCKTSYEKKVNAMVAPCPIVPMGIHSRGCHWIPQAPGKAHCCLKKRGELWTCSALVFLITIAHLSIPHLRRLLAPTRHHEVHSDCPRPDCCAVYSCCSRIGRFAYLRCTWLLLGITGVEGMDDTDKSPHTGIMRDWCTP